jgi:hypothetical protein
VGRLPLTTIVETHLKIKRLWQQNNSCWKLR